MRFSRNLRLTARGAGIPISLKILSIALRICALTAMRCKRMRGRDLMVRDGGVVGGAKGWRMTGCRQRGGIYVHQDGMDVVG